MPIIDTEWGISIGDSKPIKICQWYDCPNYPNYPGGLKMKACKRCGWVRYCSKKCQSMDWPVHKPVCQIPPIIDIGAWIRSNRWLFKWACYEALGRNGQNLTLTHGLVISLIRTDRLVGPTPCHFFVHEIKVGQMADGGGPPVPDKRTAEIMRTGGLGTTAIKFTVSGGGMKMFRNDMLELTEPLSSAPPVPGWQNFVKAVANGEVASSDFLGMLDDARLENGEGSASFDELEQRVADMHV